MIAAILIALVRVYQSTLSKLILWTVGPVCRFEPSCSRYAVACLRDHGALRGSLLSFKRLCRCHPFHPGGYDPPPPAKSARCQGESGRSSPLPTPGDAGRHGA
jgi:putative membrane protein insertion efficiency factor